MMDVLELDARRGISGGAGPARVTATRAMRLPQQALPTKPPLLLLLLLLLQLLGAAAAPEGAGQLHQRFTVSGHSSGGMMASNHFFAYSGRIAGLGQVESGSYADGRVVGNNFTFANVSAMVSYAKASAAAGRIAPLDGVARAPIWVMEGGNDTVARQIPAGSYAFYRRLTAQQSNVVFKVVAGAEHGFATDRTPSCASCQPCGTLGAMVQECGFDMAQAMLTHLLGPLSPRVSPIASHLMTVNQSSFWPADAVTEQDIGMDRTAFVYFPAECAAAASGGQNKSTCRVHVVCISVATSPPGRPSTGTDIVTYGGFNDWGESNRIIMLYPQHATIACWQGCGRSLPADPVRFSLLQSALSLSRSLSLSLSFFLSIFLSLSLSLSVSLSRARALSLASISRFDLAAEAARCSADLRPVRHEARAAD